MSDPPEDADAIDRDGDDPDADSKAVDDPDADSEAVDGSDTEADRPHISDVHRQRPAYTESQVIMATVKVVAPFALIYGLFVTFHGGGSPGGGFQGGAIMAAVVFMIAFAFGIDAARDWLANWVLVGLAVGGTVIFAGVGFATIVLGGAFLQYDLLPIPDPVMWGMETVEILGIAPIVASVLVGLFFLLAIGFESEGYAQPTATDGGTDDDDTAADAREGSR